MLKSKQVLKGDGSTSKSKILKMQSPQDFEILRFNINWAARLY